jgi:hypothetical protein
MNRSPAAVQQNPAGTAASCGGIWNIGYVDINNP